MIATVIPQARPKPQGRQDRHKRNGTALQVVRIGILPTEHWRPGMTMLEIWSQINAIATLPGVTPASPLQPIEGRVVMLQSGIKAPMAIPA